MKNVDTVHDTKLHERLGGGVSTPSSGRANSHGVTGGVYKALERIHRGMLIRDY